MQRGAFFLQVNFHHFLGVVPGAAGVGHVKGLEQAEGGDRDQIAGKQVGVKTGKGNGEAENHHKDVKHAFLRVDGADSDHFLGIFDRSRLIGVELDVFLDIGDRAVSAGRNRLH